MYSWHSVKKPVKNGSTHIFSCFKKKYDWIGVCDLIQKEKLGTLGRVPEIYTNIFPLIDWIGVCVFFSSLFLHFSFTRAFKLGPGIELAKQQRKDRRSLNAVLPLVSDHGCNWKKGETPEVHLDVVGWKLFDSMGYFTYVLYKWWDLIGVISNPLILTFDPKVLTSCTHPSSELFGDWRLAVQE